MQMHELTSFSNRIGTRNRLYNVVGLWNFRDQAPTRVRMLEIVLTPKEIVSRIDGLGKIILLNLWCARIDLLISREHFRGVNSEGRGGCESGFAN